MNCTHRNLQFVPMFRGNGNCTGTTSANHGPLEAYIFTKPFTLYLGENAMGLISLENSGRANKQ